MTDPQDRFNPDQTNNPAPQYGQRSEEWNPNGPAEPQSPWPVYTPGQEGVPPNQPPAVPPPGYGTPPPAGPPTGQPVYGQPVYGQPVYQPMTPTNLPSRAWSIVTMIAGVILMVIVAPAVLFGSVLSGIDFDRIADGSISVSNGGQVTVGESGTLALMSQSERTPSKCEITGESGTFSLTEESGSGVVVGRNLPSGTYSLKCDLPDGAPMFAFTGEEISGLVGKATSGLIWSGVVGLVGLIALIVGIVWLVKVNRKRRELTRMQWGPQPPYQV
ncbi:hypothetical protein [Scrofimicrobium sp. R131]|uniref:SD-repeat containing protein B domain-containing protein n=1 Tax=Scrofimicrobium appendicitidis TaxID=3079930 RepID=A0AAU7V8V0_9ACTO